MLLNFCYVYLICYQVEQSSCIHFESIQEDTNAYQQPSAFAFGIFCAPFILVLRVPMLKVHRFIQNKVQCLFIQNINKNKKKVSDYYEPRNPTITHRLPKHNQQSLIAAISLLNAVEGPVQ